MSSSPTNASLPKLNNEFEARGRQGRHLKEREQNAALARQSIDAAADEELILTYFQRFHALEQALLQAGFARTIGQNQRPRPDWFRWARHIEKQFDPAAAPELEASVSYLLIERDMLNARDERLFHPLPYESLSPFSDMVWLAEMVQQTDFLLTRQIHLPGATGCGPAQVMCALLVVEEWLKLASLSR